MGIPLREFIGSMAGGVELAGDGAPPTRFRIAAFGKNSTSRGPFELRREDAAQMVADSEARKIKLSSDYEHAALHAANVGAEAPASSWFRLELGEDGLYARDIEWTPRALERLKSREYRYFSPWFGQRADGSVASFKNFALTNRPAMDGLTPLVASADANPATPESPKMKTILKHLALADDASEAEVLTRVHALTTERDAVYSAAGGQDLASTMAAIVSMKQSAAKATELEAKLTALTKGQEEKEKELVLSQCIADFQIEPALKDFWASQPLDVLKSFQAQAPKKVRNAGTSGAPASKDPALEQDLSLSDADKEVAARLGISVEKMLASKKQLLSSVPVA